MKAIILDMDDTIIPCGTFYRAVKREFGQYQAARLGLDAGFCEALLDHIDVHCLSLPNAFGRTRLPRSFRSTSYALDSIMGDIAQHPAAERSYDIGNSVFDAPYYLFDGVREMLDAYKKAGFELFLLTKGDEEIQQAKINMNNLTEVIPSNNIYIVPKKSPENITTILANHKLVPGEVVMVGDSLRDDIGSAIGAGVHSVLVSENSNKGWAYENTAHQPSYAINNILDLPTVIKLS